MITFIEYLSEAIGSIKASGNEADRHQKKYIDPHVGSGEFTHITSKKHDDLPEGSRLKLHRVEKINGVTHVHAEDEHGGTHAIPVSKLQKPGAEKENKGHQYESDFIEHLKKNGVMPKHLTGAGSTAGTDFQVEHKKNKKQHGGKVQGDLLNGETKNGVTGAMGQITIHHSPEKGWHIPDDARAKRPQYAAEVEKAGLLDHMNKHHDPDKHGTETTESGRAKSVVIKHPSLEPGHAYLKDHHVHILQVGGHGTYRVGDSDVTGHGLPAISGHGKWTIREKQLGNKRARTVMFQPDGKKGLDKSHVDLDKSEHLEAFKKTLGIAK